MYVPQGNTAPPPHHSQLNCCSAPPRRAVRHPYQPTGRPTSAHASYAYSTAVQPHHVQPPLAQPVHMHHMLAYSTVVQPHHVGVGRVNLAHSRSTQQLLASSCYSTSTSCAAACSTAASACSTVHDCSLIPAGRSLVQSTTASCRVAVDPYACSYYRNQPSPGASPAEPMLRKWLHVCTPALNKHHPITLKPMRKKTVEPSSHPRTCCTATTATVTDCKLHA